MCAGKQSKPKGDEGLLPPESSKKVKASRPHTEVAEQALLSSSRLGAMPGGTLGKIDSGELEFLRAMNKKSPKLHAPRLFHHPLQLYMSL